MPYSKIKRKRKERGLSQDDMADRLGLSASAYGKLERGETRIDLERLKQIASALGMEVLDFLSSDVVVVDHSGGSNRGSNEPTHDAGAEVWQKMVDHMEAEIAALRNNNAILRQEKDQLLKLVERLTK